MTPARRKFRTVGGIKLVVSEELFEMLRDQVVRERELYGREVTERDVLEAGINRCLDALEGR